MLKLSRVPFLSLCGLLIILAMPATVGAIGRPITLQSIQGIVQSYTTDMVVRQGMIVGLKPGNSTVVEPLTSNTLQTMLGVAVSASDAAITLSGGTDTAQIYVATAGQYDVLVSNQNGPIKTGDYISISTLDGVGMKALDSEGTIIGKAAADFSGTGNVESTATIKMGSSTRVVSLGMLPVDIAVGGNPNTSHGTGNLPGFLQIASNTIASKPVDASRVYLSLVILLLTAVIAGSLLYGGVRSGIVSIGRNPLAKKSIVRGLVQVILTSIIIFVIGLFAVYLLLRL